MVSGAAERMSRDFATSVTEVDRGGSTRHAWNDSGTDDAKRGTVHVRRQAGDTPRVTSSLFLLPNPFSVTAWLEANLGESRRALANPQWCARPTSSTRTTKTRPTLLASTSAITTSTSWRCTTTYPCRTTSKIESIPTSTSWARDDRTLDSEKPPSCLAARRGVFQIHI